MTGRSISDCCLNVLIYMFHSDILASFNFNKNKILSPGHICQDCWKNTRSTFECMVILQSRGQGPDSCWKYGTDLSRSFWILSPGFENIHTFKCWSGIFPTILTYMIMLKNCKNNITVYGCSPIQGTAYYSCWNNMKPGSQSGTYIICSRVVCQMRTNIIVLTFLQSQGCLSQVSSAFDFSENLNIE